MKMKRVLPIVATAGVLGGVAVGTIITMRKRNGGMAKKRPEAQSPAVQQRS
ncbi:MAG: hypothetical protein WCV62_04705 [Candidatus Peribacteraceae bacterium]|jgi:hypothetical protein